MILTVMPQPSVISSYLNQHPEEVSKYSLDNERIALAKHTSSFNNKWIEASLKHQGTAAATTTQSNLVTEVRPYDILNGRCAASFNNVGNRRFRLTISINLKRYMDAPTRQAKGKVIKSVVRMLRDEVGARLLQKTKDGYIELSEKKMRQKVGHALRDLSVQMEPSSSPSSTAASNKESQLAQAKAKVGNTHMMSQPNENISNQSMGTHTNIVTSYFGDDDASIGQPIPLGNLDQDIMLFNSFHLNW